MVCDTATARKEVKQMTSKQFVTCWENRHTGETGHGNPTTIEMATAVAAFGDILYPHREHFVEPLPRQRSSFF